MCERENFIAKEVLWLSANVCLGTEHVNKCIKSVNMYKQIDEA